MQSIDGDGDKSPITFRIFFFDIEELINPNVDYRLAQAGTCTRWCDNYAKDLEI